MIRTLFAGLIVISFNSYCQTSPTARQRALNNYITYANDAAEDVTFVFNRILSYYPQLPQFKKETQRPYYVCDNQLDDRYYDKALAESSVLTDASTLNVNLKSLHAAAQLVDEKCKALDTYHKLKDYERDNFKQADQLIVEIQAGLVDFRKKLAELVKAVEASYSRIQPTIPGNSYYLTDQMMRKEIAREKMFMDSLRFNVNEGNPTAWPVELLQQSILDTEKGANLFAQAKLNLKYPSANMIGAFKEDLTSFLSSKRNALDGYNFAAKKSDKHSNEAYILWNSHYGNLIHDHNQFLEFAKGDGFYGLQSVQYIALFEIRTASQQVVTEVKPFKDLPYAPLKPVRQNTPISKQTFTALGNYIEFINASVDQVSYLHRVLRNYNSSATYYKDLTSYKGKGGLTHSFESYEIPLSLYQMAVTQSTGIPAAYRKSLNDQTDVLLSILKEMEALNIALALDCKEKRYERDNIKRGFEILERSAELFQIFDSKKEQLYRDARAVYESYAKSNPTGSWQVSNKALLDLVDEDRVQLFKAKAFFRGDSSSIPVADLIDQQLRDIISKEFSNMKGIERLGRYNGNCPYSPYEDVPSNSRTLSEKITRIKSLRTDTYEGPYHDFVYIYNVIAYDYNKFCELAKVDLLQTIEQPEFFFVKYPPKKTPPVEKPKLQETVVEDNSDDVVKHPIVIAIPPSKRKKTPGGEEEVTTHSTHTNTNTNTNELDTVYIEKHDTIYIDHPANEDPTSMEGYASNNLVFLLDVSGSMSDGSKLPLLKKSMLVLLNMLRPEDFVSVVVYSGKAQVVLPSTSCQDKAKVKRVIENLEGDGYTDGNAGIQLAYKVADQSYIRAGNNRIVLATDGEFGVSNPTMKMVEKFANQDIFLSVFVFGKETPTSKVLTKLTTTGKGHYEKISAENSDSKLIREAKAKRKK